ncbi:MAG TPA: hypothetical protein VFZ03_14340 [Dongiaceae bacterium]
MVRKIQSQSPRSGTKGFAGLLGNAIFWLIVAIVLPVQAITGVFPEFAPYAPFAPLLFYGLALLSFVRGLLALRGAFGARRAVNAGRLTAARGGQNPGGQSSRPSQGPAGRQANQKSGLPVIRTPTVQRMR